MRSRKQGGRGDARLRLGVDFHTFDGIYQGSRSHLLGLYREAIVQAPDIDFVFFLSGPARLRAAYPEFSRGNVELVGMPHRPGIWRLAWQLPSMARRHAIDLLHLQYRLPFFLPCACMCTLHDVLFESHPQFFGALFVRMARRSARHAVRRSDILLTVSAYSRAQIALHYATDAARIAITPNAVDRERFHPSAERDPRLARWQLEPDGYLCMLGRLEPRKNHLALLRAYARLDAGTPPLVLVGQRDFAYAAIFQAIRDLQLEQRVRILEDVDDAALPAVLRHARLMVYPSQAEGFGMPVLEALASGVPVITSNTTSLPEVAGPAAWLVSPSDEQQLLEALRQALSETLESRRSRIERGMQHAARFNWKDSAATLLTAVRSAG